MNQDYFSQSRTIAICSSVSFYEQVAELKNQLQAAGHTVLVPDLVLEMEKRGDFTTEAYAEQFDSANPHRKRQLIEAHFRKIEQSEVVLVVNENKHGIDGYIGANVLMEMTVGFYLGKLIYVTKPVSSQLSCYDEVMAMGVIEFKV
jgi:hypothetical protein